MTGSEYLAFVENQITELTIQFSKANNFAERSQLYSLLLRLKELKKNIPIEEPVDIVLPIQVTDKIGRRKIVNWLT